VVGGTNNRRQDNILRLLRVLLTRPSDAPESLSTDALPLSSPPLSSSEPRRPADAALQFHERRPLVPDVPALRANNTPTQHFFYEDTYEKSSSTKQYPDQNMFFT